MTSFAPPSNGAIFPGLVLAGTDTAVGKTTLGRALLRLAARRGLHLAPFKPVETGCADLPPSDTLSLIEAAGTPTLSPRDVCPYTFSAPLAPSVAARLEGRTVDPEVLRHAARHLASRADALLVEGAGGLLSPWGPGLHLGTLAADLRLPLAIVAANRLGTINHTALTASECRRRQLACLGFVLVDVSPISTADHDTNAEEIVRETGLPCLGTLPHLDATDTDSLADCAAANLDIPRIFLALSRRPAG